MKTSTRSILGIAVGALAVYCVGLPFLWPEPEVSAQVPAQAGAHDTLSMVVTVNAWHPNFDVSNVRFYVDYTNTTAKGPKGIFNPEIILDRQAANYRYFSPLNLVTAPSKKSYIISLPLGKYVDEGLLGPGELIGKLDITFNYLPGIRGKNFSHDPTRLTTKSAPFRITIHE